MPSFFLRFVNGRRARATTHRHRPHRTGSRGVGLLCGCQRGTNQSVFAGRGRCRGAGHGDQHPCSLSRCGWCALTDETLTSFEPAVEGSFLDPVGRSRWCTGLRFGRSGLDTHVPRTSLPIPGADPVLLRRCPVQCVCRVTSLQHRGTAVLTAKRQNRPGTLCLLIFRSNPKQRNSCLKNVSLSFSPSRRRPNPTTSNYQLMDGLVFLLPSWK